MLFSFYKKLFTQFMLYANTQAFTDSFRNEVLMGIHALGTSVVRAGTSADTLKAALFLSTATRNASTTVYNTTGEVTGTNYTAGGVTVTNGQNPQTTSNVGHWTPTASFAWTNVTLTTAFDAVELYNSTQGDKTIAVYTFGDQTVTAGDFTLTMPTDDNATALIRLA